jgi:hypothetical protein
MNQPPEDARPGSSEPDSRGPADQVAEAPADEEPAADVAARRKEALRRFVQEHREWLDEMSQH